MNFEVFVQQLIENKVVVSLEGALDLWEALGIARHEEHLNRYRDAIEADRQERKHLQDQIDALHAELDAQADKDAPVATDDAALLALRAKLIGDPAEQLVASALGMHGVMWFVKRGQKIHAVKELRARTNAGLMEAKTAIEDSRVWGTYAPPA